jgi:hypothetical protein
VYVLSLSFNGEVAAHVLDIVTRFIGDAQTPVLENVNEFNRGGDTSPNGYCSNILTQVALFPKLSGIYVGLEDGTSVLSNGSV